MNGPSNFWKRAQRTIAGGIRAVNKHAKPALTVAGHIGSALEVATRPSPLMVVGALSRATADLESWAQLQTPRPSPRQFISFTEGVIWDTVLPLLLDGQTPNTSPFGDPADGDFEAVIDGIRARANESLRRITVMCGSADALFELIDRVAPRAIDCAIGRHGLRQTRVLTEPGLWSPRAEEILDEVRPTLDQGSGRVILLHGLPGTGKSQMALWLAHQLANRRVVRAPAHRTIGSTGDVSLPVMYDVLIADEADKTAINIDRLEAIRSGTRLVILTANNGTNDRVIDGAVTRSGRIDESFEITDLGVDILPDPPFDRLDPATFERIRMWSAAALDEVRLRIKTRGVTAKALRLDEIELRHGMVCHSERVAVPVAKS